LLLALGSCLGAACGGSSRSAEPSIESFAAAASTVYVGDRTQLTAVFNGGDATIDGIGPVRSGVPVDLRLRHARDRAVRRRGR